MGSSASASSHFAVPLPIESGKSVKTINNETVSPDGKLVAPRGVLISQEPPCATVALGVGVAVAVAVAVALAVPEAVAVAVDVAVAPAEAEGWKVGT